MSHPDRELLTQLAMNDPLALDAETLVHIADCEQCSAEVAALQRVVAAADAMRDDPTLREVMTPADRVWDRIAVSAGVVTTEERAMHKASTSKMPVQAAGTRDGTLEADVDELADGRGPDGQGRPRSRRRFVVQVMAAAVIGILCGSLFTWALTGRDDDGGSNDEATVATSDLVGIDGHTTSGVASFAETPTGGELTIDLEAEDAGDGFIQAWLLDEKTGGMVALGVVDGNTGTFAVPQDLDLAAFNQIDISLEPYDGNPEHSAVSLARGPLP